MSFSSLSPDGRLVEINELSSHPKFLLRSNQLQLLFERPVQAALAQEGTSQVESV